MFLDTKEGFINLDNIVRFYTQPVEGKTIVMAELVTGTCIQIVENRFQFIDQADNVIKRIIEYHLFDIHEVYDMK